MLIFCESILKFMCKILKVYCIELTVSLRELKAQQNLDIIFTFLLHPHLVFLFQCILSYDIQSHDHRTPKKATSTTTTTLFQYSYVGTWYYLHYLCYKS